MHYIIKLFGLSSLFCSNFNNLRFSECGNVPEDDSLDLIYDELSSGEDYWGDSSFCEMELFCRKMNLNFYLKRLENLRESIFKPPEVYNEK